MTHNGLKPTVRYLRRVTLAGETGNTADGALLDRFVRQQDESAFELLIWRHGPMVLATCRRILRDRHESEDAFQATFLALFRQAASIRTKQALAGWLYRVACRIALQMRGRTNRWQIHADPKISVSVDSGEHQAEACETRTIVDEELLRLPEKYRIPIVLCHLQGKSTAVAAKLIGCPKGTLLSRLKRGRERLRRRLENRGLGLSIPAVIALLLEPSITSALVDSTVRTIANCGLKNLLPQALSAHAVSRTMKGWSAMSLAHLLYAAVLLLVFGIGAAATLSHPPAQQTSEKKNASRANTDAPRARGGNPKKPKSYKLDKTISRVQWSPDGKWLASYSSRRKTVGGQKKRFCTFKIWNARTGKLKSSYGEINNPGVNYFAFSPDSKILAISTRQTIEDGDHIELWDIEKEMLVRTIDMIYGRSRVWFDFSLDGKTLAVAWGGPRNRFGGGARLFNVQTGKLLRSMLKHKNIVISVAFSKNGKYLATGEYSGETIIWNVANGGVVRRLRKGTESVVSLAFSPDGKVLAGGSRDGLQLWDVRSGKAKELQGSPIVPQKICFTPDGTFMATAGGYTDQTGTYRTQVDFWNVRTGKLLKSWEKTSSSCIAISPDGATLAIYHGEGVVRNWDVKELCSQPLK